jgi:hypothetical protein
MHLRFLSGAMIRLSLRPIKPLEFICVALARLGVGKRVLPGILATKE